MIAHKVVTVGVVVVGGLAMLVWWWWRRRQEEEEEAPPAPPEEPPQAPPGLGRAGPSGDLNDPNDSDASIITLEIVRRRRGLPEGDDHHPSSG
ncbi:hypothetical protein C0J52_06567 [Blattella germanica]|nr:hypothetical protein C0J52_06567 [Blattella germanica]